MMPLKLINPETLGDPRGYSNGVLSETGGRLLFVAGQIGWDAGQKIVSSKITDQFERALENLLVVVREAGGKPEDLARLVIYVTDKADYISHRREIGERYRRHIGKHFPAMVLVEVKSLLDNDAKVEIEGVAVIGS